MAVAVTHDFVSAAADDGSGLIGPGEWNAEHTLQMSTGALLGRTTAGTGAVEEITAGAGLTLSGGTLASSITQYTDEQAQDAVGAMLVSSSTIQGIYSDGVPSLTFDVIDESVGVDKLTADAGSVVFGAASPGAVTELSASEVLDFVGSTRGSVLYRGASGWAALTPGTSGDVLQSGGVGADPSWVAGGGGGAPTSAQYVTLATDGTLSNERVLTAGVGIVQTDGGAGAAVTLAVRGGISTPATGANITVAATDYGKTVRYTDSVARTLTLPAAATCGDGWFIYVSNEGTGSANNGQLTIDPDASETIDGVTTSVTYPGDLRIIQCDGSAFRSVLIQGGFVEYTATGANTWTKPTGVDFVHVEAWGAGGGGGSGRKGAAASARTGGTGGGGGACAFDWFKGADVASSVTVTIGTGGTAGASQTTNSTNGNTGGAGGNTTFGSMLTAYGGGGGLAGTAANVAGGGGGGSLSAGTAGSATGGAPGAGQGTWGGGSGSSGAVGNAGGNGGGAGGGSTTSGGTGTAGGCSYRGGPGGGSGATITAANATGTGGAGGSRAAASGGGAAGGGAGVAGTAGSATPTAYGPGVGGGGGGSSTAANAGAGGAGGRAAGGGGGGAALDAVGNSGAGGVGGDGLCRIRYH